jgi:hypothetical protein
LLAAFGNGPCPGRCGRLVESRDLPPPERTVGLGAPSYLTIMCLSPLRSPRSLRVGTTHIRLPIGGPASRLFDQSLGISTRQLNSASRGVLTANPVDSDGDLLHFERPARKFWECSP